MTYRKLFIAALLLVVQIAAQAATITQEQARQKAAQFLSQQASMARGSHARPSLQLVIDSPELYGFNVGQGGQGFVIVSGDDRTAPILGYADHGSLDEATMPPAMKAWLGNYRHELSTGHLRTQRKVARAAIEPLLQSSWNQTGRYNTFCPAYMGENSVTGCVATAMAQLMNYHRWPETTTDTIPGYVTQSLQLAVDSLPPTTFDWSLMGNANSDEVAKLMFYCGASVKMDYTPLSSGASFSELSSALVRYFGYDPSLRRMLRTYYGIDEWEETVYAELAEKRPVFYAGQTYADEGHAFICDGYDGEGLFHINWGWGGFCDGYFLLSACDAESGGTGGASSSSGYSLDQEIVVGIKPLAEEPLASAARMSARALELRSEATVERASADESFTGIRVYFEHFNANASAHRFEYGIALYRGDELVSMLSRSVARVFAPNIYTYSTVSLNIGGVENGDYRIVLVSREQEQEEWQQSEGSDMRYITAHVEDTQLTLRQYPDVQLKIRKLEYPKGRRQNTANEWIATVENTGSEYNGGLWVIVDSTIVAGNGAYLRAGEMGEVRFLMAPADQVTIATDREGQNVIYTGPDVMESLTAISLNTLELAVPAASVKAGEEVEAKINVCRGVDDITSYQLAYQIDELPLVSLAKVPSLEENVAATCYFTFMVPDTISTGRHTLSVYITHINGEQLSLNDMLLQGKEINFTTYREGLGRQKVFVGHYTYTGAGYGSIVDKALAEVKGLRSDDYSIVSTHVNGELLCMDGLASIYYSQLVTSSMPELTYDRYALPGENELYRQGKFVSTGEEISKKIDEMLQMPAFATLDLKAKMVSTDKIELTVSGLAAAELQTLVGSVNLTVMLTEDSVQCPQYDGRGGYITDYQHMNVLRTVVTPVWGTPVTWKDNEFTMTFTINIKGEWNYRNMKAVAILGKPFTGNNYSQLHLVNCNDLSFADLELNPFEYPQQNQMMLAYNHADEFSERGMGSTTNGTFKAAFMMPEAMMQPLAGNQLTHIRFALNNDKVTDVKVFLANHLDSVYAYSQEVLQVKEGWNVVRLQQPFELTGDTLYVGYEFCDDMGGTLAIAYSDMPFREPDSFWFGNADNQWRNYSDIYGCVAMQAMLTGDQLPDTDLRSIALTTDSRYYRDTQDIKGQVTLTNSGKKALGRILYAAYIDGGVYTITDPEEDMSVAPGAQYQSDFSISLEGRLEPGRHTLTLIPVVDNDFHADDTISVDIYVYKDSLPRQKTLLEYATATWSPDYQESCQQVEALKAEHADVAVVALHSTDELSTGESNEISSTLTSLYSSALFNRAAINGQKKPLVFLPDNLAQGYALVAHQPAFASIELAAEYSDNAIELTVSGQTTADFDKLVEQAMLNVMLIEDSVATDDQKHNDVLRLCATDTWGDSLVVADNRYTQHYRLEVESDWHPEQMHVVAFISRPYADGNIAQLDVINCETLSLKETVEAGITQPLASDALTIVQRFAPDGRRLQAPQRGLNIVRHANGTVRKVIVK